MALLVPHMSKFEPVLYSDDKMIITPSGVTLSSSPVMSLDLSTSKSLFPLITTKPGVILTTTDSIGAPSTVIFPVNPSLDLNLDPSIHDKLSKYFYYKFLDKWIKTDDKTRNLFKYLVYENKNVRLAKSMKEVESASISKETMESVEAKIKFLEKHISHYDIQAILARIVKYDRINWYDLDKNNHYVRDMIRHGVKKLLSKHL